MKILVVTSEYPSSLAPNRASFNRQHLNALAEKHDVAVFCPVSWRSRLKSAETPPTAPPGISKAIDVTYATYFYPPGVARGSYDSWMWHSVKGQLLSFAREQKPDLVLGVWCFPDGRVAVKLGALLGVPAVVQVLGSDINLLSEHPGKKKKTLSTLQQANGVIAVSRALKQAVLGMGIDEQKLAVVYRGVNAEMFAPRDLMESRQELGLERERQHLLFIGNLVPVKNPELLLRAFLAASFHRQVTLHFVGEGPLRRDLEALAQQCDDTKMVRFHGTVPHKLIPVWMAAADCLILPSRAEGVPNVLLEARSMGCPYIATDVGGVAEVSDHPGAVVVPSSDESALRRRLEAVVANPVERVPRPWQSWASAGEALALQLEEVKCRYAR